MGSHLRVGLKDDDDAAGSADDDQRLLWFLQRLLHGSAAERTPLSWCSVPRPSREVAAKKNAGAVVLLSAGEARARQEREATPLEKTRQLFSWLLRRAAASGSPFS